MWQRASRALSTGRVSPGAHPDAGHGPWSVMKPPAAMRLSHAGAEAIALPFFSARLLLVSSTAVDGHQTQRRGR